MNRHPSYASLRYETALLGVLFLAFFWLISRFIEAIYTFGLLGVDIPPEIASAAFLLTPLLLPLFPRQLAGRRGQRMARFTGALALTCQGLSLLLAARERMLVSGLGVGLMLVCLPAALKAWRLSAAGLGGGLMLAGLATIALRAFNHGSDLLGGPVSQAINLLTALAGIILLLRFTPSEEEAPPPARAAGFWPTAGRYLGLTGAVLLLCFGFIAPTVIARWTGASYPWVHGAVLGALVLFSALWFGQPGFRARLTPRVLLIWAALFVLALALALLPHQLRFPAAPADFPIDAKQPGPLAYLALALALLLHPVIYAAAARLAGSLVEAPPTPRGMAGAAALASLFLLVMVFAHVFTTVYDYIPVAGPPFRDRFWLVIIVPGLVMALTLRHTTHPTPDARRVHPLVPAVFALALLPVLLAPTLVPPANTGESGLRVMTYNIQQGYDTQGEKAYARQLELIRAQAPHILGLQESDTARIANGNGDVVRYFSEGLGMDAYYGPTTVTGTFGIALLSRYPIEDPRTFYMYSAGEQTAAILATIRVDGQAYSVLVTHLGNSGPLIQQQQVLARLAGQPNSIAMGDFNFDPSEEQYRQTVAVYSDAWAGALEQHLPDPGYPVSERIDHIFLSPNLQARRAAYLAEGPSDHPALVVDLLP